jgi:hypothetical protein
MAETQPTTCANLRVTFSREGELEEQFIVSDGDRALRAALRIIAGLDALRAGDTLTCEWHRDPGLVERGLA